MGLVSIQATSYMSKNVSSPHRISFKSHWKIERTEDLDEVGNSAIRLSRAFHLPSGLSTEQTVLFAGVRLSLNDIPKPLTIIEGLATSTFTGMMQSINRVEIRWRVEPFATLQLPEHFVAWLEIMDFPNSHSQRPLSRRPQS
jgi:hypothetical protein